MIARPKLLRSIHSRLEDYTDVELHAVDEALARLGRCRSRFGRLDLAGDDVDWTTLLVAGEDNDLDFTNIGLYLQMVGFARAAS